MKYFFRLGKTPNLSIAEITTVYNLRPDFLNTEILVTPDIETQIHIDKLGGTIKIGFIMDEVASFEEIKNLIINDISVINGKKIFGLTSLSSAYGQDRLNRLGIEIKKELGSARFVTSKEKELSSVIVTKEKLLTKGGDYYILNLDDKTYLAKTSQVQDFESYDHRDYDRPRADSKSGMIPPKLAQIMVNLGGKNSGTLVDPFCGSGTILQEALLLGFNSVIGSDKSEKAVDDSVANLEWLAKEYKLNIDNVCLNHLPIEELKSQVTAADVIVTEPYLGPPLRGGERREHILKTVHELEKLFIKSFEVYRGILPPVGRVVTVIPAFRYKDEIIYLDILPKIKDLGFNLINNFSDVESKGYRYPLVYSRADQKLIREVVVFGKK